MKKNTLLKILIGLVAVLIILVSASFMGSRSENKYEKADNFLDSIANSDESTYSENMTEINREIRNNWNTYFKINNNKYNYYDIGGIENLQISFTNDSDYLVNNAYVDVCYIIDDGSCYKTESLLFKNVQPHTIVTQNAPNSSRGKEISLEFSQIYSDKLNFLYGQSNLGTRSSIDPYFSKD